MRINHGIAWPRLIAESLAIVASILLAFAIDAWWDVQQTFAVEQELLSNLEVGLEENARMAVEAIKMTSSDYAILQSFVAMTPEEAEEIPSGETYSTISALWRPNTGTLNTAAVVATLESSATLLRSSPRLRTALALWRGATDSVAWQISQPEENTQDVVYALAAHTELQALFARLEGQRLLSNSVMREVREDNEVMRLVAQKGHATYVNRLLLEIVERQATAALEILREEQQQR